MCSLVAFWGVCGSRGVTELEFCLSAMVLWNDGHKSIKNFKKLNLNNKLFPLESSLLLTYPRIALSNQPDGERLLRSPKQ
jgi:hypothetical protein